MKRTRRLGIALTPILAMVALSAVAFACTALATLSPSETTGPAGSRITMTGKQLEPLPVELHWNSVSGPVLGTAEGPAFSTAITIPAAATAAVNHGNYYIFAVQHHADGTINKVPAAFEVTSGPAGVPAHPADGAVQSVTTSGGGLPVAVVAGLAVLSVGVVGLTLGLGVATLRRQRAAVSSRPTDKS